jgi:RNase P subunit RPR2
MTIYCADRDCSILGEHSTACTNDDCTGCWPRTADWGYLCQRHYDRVDHAVQVAEYLQTALRGAERAVTADGNGSTVPGPQLPLTPLQLDLDEILRASADYRGDVKRWISTQNGAHLALAFARIVYNAERRHPTVEAERKLHRLRCPNCNRLTATWRPPAWPGDNVTITCLTCNWTATHPDAIDIVTAIETRCAA